MADQIGSPTYARDLADAILQMIKLDNWKGELFNFCNDGIISWFEFAQEIMEIADLKCDIVPILSKDYSQKAKRPSYSVLDCSKFVDFTGISTKNWKQSLIKCIQTIKESA